MVSFHYSTTCIAQLLPWELVISTKISTTNICIWTFFIVFCFISLNCLKAGYLLEKLQLPQTLYPTYISAGRLWLRPIPFLMQFQDHFYPSFMLKASVPLEIVPSGCTYSFNYSISVTSILSSLLQLPLIYWRVQYME